MKFIFDPGKNSKNIAKHGVSLDQARFLDWDQALIWDDLRKEYGELRQAALARLVDRVHFVVFVDRVNHRRIISLRKANQREFDRYVSYINSSDR